MPFRPVSNPPNPWSTAEVDYLGNPPPTRLEVFRDSTRQILSRNDSPDVGFEFTVNPYRGCEHGCIYCYARPTHEYLGFSAYFYDLNAKTNLRLGSTSTLMLSGYFGRDRFEIGERVRASWGNAAGTLRWNQAFGGRFFSKVLVALSDYDYGIGFLGSGPAIDWTARVNSLDVKVDQAWYLDNRNTVEFGVQATAFDMQPGRIRPVGDSPIVPTELQPRYGTAPAAHLSHEARLGARVTLRYGARLSAIRREGPATI